MLQTIHMMFEINNKYKICEVQKIKIKLVAGDLSEVLLIEIA